MPTGYVGYEEGGQLTESVRRRPYQVVLLDEAEKAHRQVSNVLLQVFDEGHLTDGQGRKVDFRNTIIIMTSNLGANFLSPQNTSAENEVLMLQAVRKHFPPEFINRLDDQITFNPLSEDIMPSIVDIQLQDVSKLIKEQRITLNVNQDARHWLAKEGYNQAYGARPLKRVIYRALLHPLARDILEGKVKEGTTVNVSAVKNAKELSLEYVGGRQDAPVQPIDLLEPEGEEKGNIQN